MIQITNAGNSTIQNAELVNFVGQTVKSWTDIDNNNLELNARTISNNVYILKLTTNKGTISHKIVLK